MVEMVALLEVLQIGFQILDQTILDSNELRPRPLRDVKQKQ